MLPHSIPPIDNSNAQYAHSELSTKRYHHRQISGAADPNNFCNQQPRSRPASTCTIKLNLTHSNCTQNTGKYAVIELIGKGTFGDIWKVFNTRNKKEYVMKMVQYNNKWSAEKTRNIKTAFIKEGKKIINLNNIKTTEMGKEFIIKCKEQIGPYLILEIFGYSLIKYMKYHEINQLQVSLSTIRVICIQIFSAMSFIHGIGECIHSDLKPENILINSHLNIKIIDFGNFLSFNQKLQTFNLQTLGFRAPEVLFGNNNNISSVIDMWSIGCILYQLFANQNLFSCNNNNLNKHDIIQQIYHKLSPFPLYIYNKCNSFYFYNLYMCHNENNYIKLKTNTFLKLMYKLSTNAKSDEFLSFIDLLSCLLDVNPLTRYTSEDAIRHKFIIHNNQQFNIKRIHPIIKTSNDKQRQCRINVAINKYKMNVQSGGHNYSSFFPLTVTKRSLY